MGDDTNCPEARGPDFDFASSPILRILPDGRRIILAGQKSGVMHAIDPDRDGEVLWQARVGKGGLLGGIQWGSAADATQVYVALSDVVRKTVEQADGSWTRVLDGSVGGGLFALAIESGARQWHVPAVGCGAPPAVQSGPVGGRVGPARRGVLRLGRRPSARLCHRHRHGRLGLQRRPGVCEHQRRQDPGRVF